MLRHSCVLLMLILVFAEVFATQSPTFDRQDRDYRPLQFGKRDGYRPLQFGKRDYRPLQFGKRSGSGGVVLEPIWEWQ
ncbi:hypothetical protein GCK72_001145 [Caenorhabditis remanei]|uniref:CRE-NLP-12 protein n=4 Tax=Caenorhabditis TaxID=6237 RepID=E3LXW0_CAERE|nr:hypothetical protein GCK72_001145 [Caenorhabditis remanei]EFO84820.1 CRE-NLP-12 protein [Caenorhabditis remanei]EGT34167.1 CBN-NLP-12 protein [Caenorhabditis brenneri]EGT45454.1 hypothetical protein CAEBREN_11349 [Caenorhabditis brenneri]KAF1769328.1 hypothetical protein GCK72_001145 [Caenorhabditis remanei]